MESTNSASGDPQASVGTNPPNTADPSDHWFTERFESLLPRIQDRWPNVAKQTLEATKGSLDEVVRVISEHSEQSNYGVRDQLEELFNAAGDKTKELAESFEPLEKKLEALLDELNSTIRPRIERPVRNRPLLAIGMAAGVGILIGLMMAGGRKRP
ncbi:hypothetical protein [Prochlorococcus sp. MIT 1300]|uniref:DUF883 family protein n=1 Tax=Prochlorococcus sp. MIT 1300 TaxID=3096218 RepID=UPI002A7657C6|nr:hypothetical protein [Prochlorococcus sp. MIT 1300]